MKWYWKVLTEKNIDRLLGVYLATLLFFGWSMPAHAFFAAFFGAIAGFLGISTGAAILFTLGVVGGFVSAKRAKKKRQRQLEQLRAQIGGALVNKQGTNEPIPVVYGERIVGGIKTFIKNQNKPDSNTNDYLHVVLVLSEGPVEGIKEVYFNDELVATSTDQTGHNDNSWTYEGSYGDKTLIYFRDGSQTSALSFSGIHPDFDSTMIGHDIAFLYLRLEFDDNLFASGIPEIRAKMLGKKVPAIGSPNDGTGLSWTDEPARVIYDVLTNTRYGKGIPYDLIDAPSFNAAATYNSQLVDASATDTTQVKRYTLNGYMDTSLKVLDNVDDLLQTCRAGLITGNKYQLFQDKPTAAQPIVIDDDYVIDDITFIQTSRGDLFNRMKGIFPNTADLIGKEDVALIESTTLQGSGYDNEVLETQIEFAHTDDKNMVERILTEEINSTRQSGTLQVTVTTRLLNYTVGDVVKFTNSTLGQTEKLYRISQQKLRPDFSIELTMREYDPNIYWDNNKTIILDNFDDTDH